MKKLTYKDFRIFNYWMKFLDGTAFKVGILSKCRDSADKMACCRASKYGIQFKSVVFPVFISEGLVSDPADFNPGISFPSLEDRIKSTMHPKINFDNSI